MSAPPKDIVERMRGLRYVHVPVASELMAEAASAIEALRWQLKIRDNIIGRLVAENERLRNDLRWIPLSERQPEEYATVMVFHKGEVYCGELRHPDGEEGWDDSWWMLFKYQFPQHNWCDMAFVDAGDRWMPLPESPKE
jgi:hypothetical protein